MHVENTMIEFKLLVANTQMHLLVTQTGQVVQKHLRWMILGPFSSYSCFVIHIVWKVEREARMEPPSHTEYLRSGGAKTLILLLVGARVCISYHMRSAIPSNNVEPPLRMILAKRSLRTSESHFITESKQYL